MAVPGATALARLVATVGGDRVLAAALVAGLVAGGAGAFVLTGSGAGAGGSAGTGIVACPDDQLALLRIGNGQKMLVTGRTADGAWYRVYLGSPGRPAGWVRAGEVNLQGAGDSLPLVDCDPDAGTADAPVGPVESLTAIVAPPHPTEGSPSPTAPESPTATPTASPTPVAATVGPTGTPRASRKPRITPTPTPRVRATHTPTPKPTKTPKPPPPPTTPPPPPPPPPPADTTKPNMGSLQIDTDTTANFCNQFGYYAPGLTYFDFYERVTDSGSGLKSVRVQFVLGLVQYSQAMTGNLYPSAHVLTKDVGPGIYQVRVRAEDKAGNVAFSPNQIEVTVQTNCKPQIN